MLVLSVKQAAYYARNYLSADARHHKRASFNLWQQHLPPEQCHLDLIFAPLCKNLQVQFIPAITINLLQVV